MPCARLRAMSYQCELQVFIYFDKLIDIVAANKLWSAALCKTRVSFVAITSRTVMHMNWQIHCRECDERKLSPCKRCFTSVPPHHTCSNGMISNHYKECSEKRYAQRTGSDIRVILICWIHFFNQKLDCSDI